MNILLACGAGASTSLLMNRMIASAKAQNKDYSIRAVAKSEIKFLTDDIDVILLGPQIRYALDSIKEIVSTKNIPVEVIRPQDYGMCDGEKVLKMAEELYEEYHKDS